MLRKPLRELHLFLRANSLLIALAVIILATLGTLALLAIQQSKIEKQLSDDQQIITQIKDITTRLQAGAAERTDQYNEINRHLDCIVQFFSQPDRSKKAIADVNTCAVTAAAATTGTPAQTTPQIYAPQGIQAQPAPKSDVSQNLPEGASPKYRGILNGLGHYLNGLTGRL